MRPDAPALPLRSPVEGLRRRRLTGAQVLAQAVSAVAPSAAMATTPALVLAVAGGATLPAFAAVTVLMLLVARCVAEFSRRLASAGGVYSGVAKGLGPAGGLACAGALVVGYAAVTMASLVGVGVHAAALLGAPGRAPVAVAAAAAGAGAVLLVRRGVTLSARVVLVLEVLSVGLVSAVLLALAVALPLPRASALLPGPVSVDALLAGTALAAAAFVGFESAATLSVEAHRPFRSVPRAVLWTPAVAGAVYVLAAAGQVVWLAGADPADPVAALADLAGLRGLLPVLELGLAASFCACATASLNALVRVLFSLGREGVVPSSLGRVHPEHATPSAAATAAGVLVVAVPLVALAAGATPRDVLAQLLTLSAYGSLTAYLLVCLAAPRFLAAIGELTAGPAVVGAAGAALLTGLLGWTVGHGAAQGEPLPLVFLGLLGAVPAWLALLARRRPAQLARVGLHDETSAREVLPGSLRAPEPVR